MNVGRYVSGHVRLLMRTCMSSEPGVSAVIAPVSLCFLPELLYSLTRRRDWGRGKNSVILFATTSSDAGVQLLRQQLVALRKAPFLTARTPGDMQFTLKRNRAVAIIRDTGRFVWADALDALPLDMRFKMIVAQAQGTPAATYRGVAMLDRFTKPSARLVLLGPDRWGPGGMDIVANGGWHYVDLASAGDIVLCQRHGLAE